MNSEYGLTTYDFAPDRGEAGRLRPPPASRVSGWKRTPSDLDGRRCVVISERLDALASDVVERAEGDLGDVAGADQRAAVLAEDLPARARCCRRSTTASAIA